MKGQRADCVTSPRSKSGGVLTGIETSNRQENDGVRDTSHNAMTSIEITPVKAAPSDIKSAIRRQKRTETVDYIWHALPVTRSSKPMYRAVLTGSLRSARVQYTLTNWTSTGQTAKTSEASLVREGSLSPSCIDPSGFNSSNNKNNNKNTNYNNRSNNNNNNSSTSLSSSSSNNNSNSAGLGLRVAGVSISDIKFSEPSGPTVPWSVVARHGPAMPVSRHVKSSNSLDQKHAHSAFDEQDVERDAPVKMANGTSENHSHRRSLSKMSNGNASTCNVGAGSVGGCAGAGDINSQLSISQRRLEEGPDRLMSNSPSAMNASGENVADYFKYKSSLVKGGSKYYNAKINEKIPPGLHGNVMLSSNVRREAGEQLLTSERGKSSREISNATEIEASNNPNSSQPKTPVDSANQVTKVTKAFTGHQLSSPRRADSNSCNNSNNNNNNNKNNNNKNDHNNNNNKKRHHASANANELTCVQLADSIMAASHGDLYQVYSLFKPKLRYSDFIEQSQPHRLGMDTALQLHGVPDASDLGDPSPPTGSTTSPEGSSQQMKSHAGVVTTRSTTSSTLGTNESKEETRRLPAISEPQMAYSHLRSSNSILNISKLTRGVRESVVRITNPGKSVPSEETSLILAKAGRPILKSSKSEVQSTSKANDVISAGNNYQTTAKCIAEDANNYYNNNDNNNKNTNDNVNNNPNASNHRLVRFNTCHEIREFTPSEPIIQ